MTQQHFTPMLQGDDAIAVAGMRLKSMPEEVLSLPLMVDPTYPVKDGSPIYLTADKKGCTTVANGAAGFVGFVVLHGIGKSGKTDGIETYLKGDIVPVMVKGKLWVVSGVKVTDTTTAIYATATGMLTNTDTGNTKLNGVRWSGISISSQNLTPLEITGV